MLKILHVVGARPNFMKVAPVMRAMAACSNIQQCLVHTGQHYSPAMSLAFFGALDLPEPDYNLQVGSGTHAQQTAEVMRRFEPVLQQVAPKWVLVPGDVNSTLACALVAAKLQVRVAHLEAGLRSFDRTMPEETNRVLTDHLADLLLTPSPDADENLLREGIPPHRIHRVGNLMIDTLVRLLPEAERCWRDGLQATYGGQPYALVTLHRPANVDDAGGLGRILAALARAARTLPVVFPVHPRTRQVIDERGQGPVAHPGLHLIPPLGYLEFLALQAHAAVVLTDSGGVQEETTYLGVPCLTFRDNTERPVTLTEGTNRLIGTDPDGLDTALLAALRAQPAALSRPELWDGSAAARVVAAFAAMN